MRRRSGLRRASARARRATSDTAPLDDEPRIDGLALESAEGRQELLTETRGIQPDAERSVQRLRRDERRQGRDRERGRGIAKAHLPRAVEEARHNALRDPRLFDADGGSARPQRHPELGRKRAEAASKRRPVDERSRRGLRDRDGRRLGVDDEIRVPRLLAEAPVEPVGELGGAHRPEPVGDPDLRGAAEADMAQEPLPGPASSATSSAGSRSGRAPSSRPVTRASPLGPMRRIGRSTRACAAGSAAAAASARVMPPTSTPPIVVPAGIVLRSDSATPPSAAATSTTIDGDDNRHPAPAATPARRPGRREKDVRHPAETSRGSVKRV